MKRKSNRRKQGELFETYGVKFLELKGYKFLEKNYYTKFGEIDLIMQKDKTIIFVEVKQRSSDIFGSGEYSINYNKKRKMYLSAKQYILEKKYYDWNIRFDALIFSGRNKTPYNWIENIIWGDEIGF